MHFHAEVHLKSLENWEKELDDIMSKYHEDDGGFYDYWDVGGRFAGAHSQIKIRNFFTKHPDNIVLPVKDLPEDLIAYTLIANGQVFHWEEDGKEEPIKKKLKELGITDGYVVTVDCHI